jgi:hypothetical protein
MACLDDRTPMQIFGRLIGGPSLGRGYQLRGNDASFKDAGEWIVLPSRPDPTKGRQDFLARLRETRGGSSGCLG